MVVTAVESAYDPVAGEVKVFRFLQLLQQATREYERQAVDGLLDRAMEAVEDRPRSDDSDGSGRSMSHPQSNVVTVSRHQKSRPFQLFFQ